MALDPEFLSSISKGLYDRNIQSQDKFRPTLLLNDPKEGKKVLSSILSYLRICESYFLAVAFVTKGGVMSIFNRLLDLDRQGKKGRILVSRYLNFSQPEALKTLKNLKNVDLRISDKGAFHAKSYTFLKADGYSDIILGSSNLTESALSTNKEWNLRIAAHQDSGLMKEIEDEFESEFEAASPVTDEYIAGYERFYQAIQAREAAAKAAAGPEGAVVGPLALDEPKPNRMQVGALANLSKLRQAGQTKALIVSATGSGKTFLSAFDVKAFNAERLLFVVHRRNIAQAALKTFKRIYGQSKTMGLLSGESKDFQSDFIFSTNLTIANEEVYTKFDPYAFDYIIIDESHRSGADSYKRIIDYFKPKFLLGMTATPERNDGFDVYGNFDHNIACDIRLKDALEEDMVSPFHYFGVTDIEVNGKPIDDKTSFSQLVSDERVRHVIQRLRQYGTDSGETCGLVFCSKVEECHRLAVEFQKNGYRTLALDGDSSEEERSSAIDRLEGSSVPKELDLLFTVDIFNEGVDLPRVNLAVMLRPTESAIIFVQQLGRGLRKQEGKQYLTVIDFVGNYEGNFNIPVALFGDNTYDADRLRRLVTSGSALIPGTSTVNFERIVEERILESINSAKFSANGLLRLDFKNLAAKLGRNPMMMDFVEHGYRDPALYAPKRQSYLEWCTNNVPDLRGAFTPEEIEVMGALNLALVRGKTPFESKLLKLVLGVGAVTLGSFQESMKDSKLEVEGSGHFDTALRVLNGTFYGRHLDLLVAQNGTYVPSPLFSKALANGRFKEYLLDLIKYAEYRFWGSYTKDHWRNGLLLFEKYSREDVSRLLQTEKNWAGVLNGYKMVGKTCPIFVNYVKEDGISETTKYDDKFLDEGVFSWMTQSRRNLTSKIESQIIDHVNVGIDVLLFVKMSNDEGLGYYFLGQVDVIKGSAKEMRQDAGGGKTVPIVNMRLALRERIPQDLYDYLTKYDRVQQASAI